MATLPKGAFLTPGNQIAVFLRCPRCTSEMNGIECPLCTFRMEIRAGIIHALPPERSAHFERFTKDYEYIRDAEGRSSQSDRFYLELPYTDVTGRNSEQWSIRARSYGYLLGDVLKRQLISGALVLDIGAGNCWMSYRLALAGYRPFATDLLTNDHDGLGAARRYRSVLPALFPRFQAEMSSLPFQDEQFDAVIFNASFHYAEDYKATLREALRCVRQGGIIIVCDTPWYSRDASGQQMLKERRATFFKRYGTASDSIKSQEYLTDARLRELEQSCSIRWELHAPGYGLKWAMRPLLAKLRGRREPSRFRIYVTRKNA
jgi:SAM-dependent methyltransferase